MVKIVTTKIMKVYYTFLHAYIIEIKKKTKNKQMPLCR